MMLDAEDLAALQDEDFTHLGGLNQIHWAPSQTEQWRKLMPTFQFCANISKVSLQTRNILEQKNQILADQKVKFQDLRFFPIECGPWHR